MKSGTTFKTKNFFKLYHMVILFFIILLSSFTRRHPTNPGYIAMYVFLVGVVLYSRCNMYREIIIGESEIVVKRNWSRRKTYSAGSFDHLSLNKFRKKEDATDNILYLQLYLDGDLVRTMNVHEFYDERFESELKEFVRRNKITIKSYI